MTEPKNDPCIAIARKVRKARPSKVITKSKATIIETTFQSPNVFSPHFFFKKARIFPQNKKFHSFYIGATVLLKFQSFPEFNSLYEPW